MHRRTSQLLALTLLVGLVPTQALPQGQGSAGVHLDILANRTSTHSAVADVPGGPVYPLVPAAGAGLAGNPYQAYADYGTVFTLRLSVAESTLDPPGAALPFGPGSLVTIFWGIDVPANIFLPAGACVPPCIPPKNPARPLVVSVIGGIALGIVVDGLSLLTPPPPPFTPVPADPGHPHKLEVPLLIPLDPLVLVHTFTFQAVIVTPTGALALSNGVQLKVGGNPNEIPVAMTPCNGYTADDEGNAGIPIPPGFLFYDTPPASAWMNTNGFIWFSLTLMPPMICGDFSGTPGDFGGGCVAATATAAPRVDVNHFDVDIDTSGPPVPLVGDFTVETAPAALSAPPGFPAVSWPGRTIVRWKNVRRFGSPSIAGGAPDTDYASMVCELWGGDAPIAPANTAHAIIVVRQHNHIVTTQATTNSLNEQIGIGPGTAGQAFGGPPPVCTALTLWSDSYAASSCAAAAKDALYMDNLLDSHMLSNLAVRFQPTAAGGLYCARVF